MTVLRHLRDSGWSPFVPLLLTFVVFFAFIGSRSLVECDKPGAGCQKAHISALVRADTSVAFGAHTANYVSVDRLRGGDSVRVRALGIAAKRQSGRLVWAFFVGVSLATTLTAYIVSWLLLLPSAGERPRRTQLYFAGVLGLSLVLGGVLLVSPEGHMNLMLDVLKETIGSARTLGAVEPAERLINFITSFEQAAALALVLSCSLLLLPAKARDTAMTNDPETILRRELRPTLHRIEMLRVFLYSSTIFLIVGVLRMQATGSWVVTFVHPQEAGALDGVLQTLSWVMGAFYSLILTAVYLPTAYILRARAAAAIADSGAEREFKEAVASEGGLAQPIGASIARIAALLGPLLAAGPISYFVKLMGG
jgi:hypothetical protein